MSKAKAKEALLSKITSTLKPTGNYREELNKEVHVMDLSKENLMLGNKISQNDEVEFTKAYEEFIQEIKKQVPKAKSTNIGEVIVKLSTTKSNRSRFVNERYLVTKTYNTARDVLTAISKAIPKNIYFGQSYRTREYSEYEAEKDVGVKKNLLTLVGKCFLKDDYKPSIVIKTAENQPSWKLYDRAYKYIAYKDTSSSEYKISEISSKDFGRQLAVDEEGEPKTIPTSYNQPALVYDQRILSKLDVGHIFSSRTPLKEKFLAFQQSIKAIGLGDYKNEIQNLINEAQKELVEKHGSIEVKFHNIADENGKVVAVIEVVPQFYKINTELAKFEAEALRKVISEVSRIADTIPGSNTLRQDIVELNKNKLLQILGLPTKKVSKHDPVAVKVDLISAKINSSTKKVGITKTKQPSKKPPVSRIRTATGQFFSLASLQKLLDASLIQRVKDNMGTGSRRDILNLRSGRFAESVKVERLSQSREGMITAFYNYMKNPYATFSQGGRQESPKTRDPKLLIAKSIREIGATMVANRMRAVLV